MIPGLVVSGLLAAWAWDARSIQPVVPSTIPWQRLTWETRPTCARPNAAADSQLGSGRVEVTGERHADFEAAVEPTPAPASAAPPTAAPEGVVADAPSGGNVADAPARGSAHRRATGDPMTRAVQVRAVRKKPAPPAVPGRYELKPADIAQQIASFEDVVRSVQALPGVGSASDLHGEFFVRGSGANANSIWLDGIEITFPYHILGFNSIFNPGMLAGGEFWTGGAPVRFGNATGGVLSCEPRCIA
jgi:hypothetical protein